MPWQSESVMLQRQKLVEKMLLPGSRVDEVCSEFGVSRKTAYKWLKRYQEGGLESLADMSRRPVHQPNRSADLTEERVIQAHHQFPHWGPYKLKHYLINEQLLQATPSHRTIGRILKRHGCEVIKNHRSAPAKTRFERDRPNALWQMDFKGSFMTQAARCYPLTVLDDHSRFSMGLKACQDETKQTVKAHLESIFQDYGLPDQINVDNGNPWGAADLESLTSLQVWLIKLGIKLTHSAPYHPQTNGKDERFHRSLKLEVLHQRKYKNQSDIQKAFDEWRHVYNFKRPHQAIGNLPPSSRYQPSARQWSDQEEPYYYNQLDLVRKVTKDRGMFCFKGKRYRAGKGLSGEYIAIKETEQSDQYAIFFRDQFIKKFRLQESVA